MQVPLKLQGTILANSRWYQAASGAARKTTIQKKGFTGQLGTFNPPPPPPPLNIPSCPCQETPGLMSAFCSAQHGNKYKYLQQ